MSRMPLRYSLFQNRTLHKVQQALLANNVLTCVKRIERQCHGTLKPRVPKQSRKRTDLVKGFENFYLG